VLAKQYVTEQEPAKIEMNDSGMNMEEVYKNLRNRKFHLKRKRKKTRPIIDEEEERKEKKVEPQDIQETQSKPVFQKEPEEEQDIMITI
jgi:hypothetical protein